MRVHPCSNCSPTDHLVRVHPSAYEEPIRTQKWSATAHVLSNPVAASNLPYYAESQFNAQGITAHYEFDSEITSKQEYDRTVHPMCNGQHKVDRTFVQNIHHNSLVVKCV